MNLIQLRNRALRVALETGQRARVDVLPRHFYSAIPDLRSLRQRRDWRLPRSMTGIAGMDLQAQLGWLATLGLSDVPFDVYTAACEANGAIGYGPNECSVLYGFVATERPRRIVMVGAGVSTSVVLRAAREHDLEVDVTCVDPFPTDYLRDRARSGDIHLLEEPAQTVAMETYTELGAGDLLFVDSTHTVAPGSEVNRLILEVLPRLRSGVWVHFHDITWPYDYARDLLGDRLFFWEESTLLQAFMINNSAWTVRACLSALHYGAKAELQGLLPAYRPQADDDGLISPTTPAAGELYQFPSSTYLRAT